MRALQDKEADHAISCRLNATLSRHCERSEAISATGETQVQRDCRGGLRPPRNDTYPITLAICSNAITTTVPDIRLQTLAITVAIITNSKRRRSMRRPRMVLRMMMNGAAKTRNGIAANVDGCGPCSSRRKLA